MFFVLLSSFTQSVDYCYVGETGKTCPEGSKAISSFSDIKEKSGEVNIYLFNGNTATFTVKDNIKPSFLSELSIKLIGDNYDNIEYVHEDNHKSLHFSMEKVQMTAMSANFEANDFVFKQVKYAENVNAFSVKNLVTDIMSFSSKVTPTKSLEITIDQEITEERTISLTELKIYVETDLKITTDYDSVTFNDKLTFSKTVYNPIYINNHKVEIEQKGDHDQNYKIQAKKSEIHILNDINNLELIKLDNSIINLNNCQFIDAKITLSANSTLYAKDGNKIGILELIDNANIITEDEISICTSLRATDCQINSKYPIKIEKIPEDTNSFVFITNATSNKAISLGYHERFILNSDDLTSFNLISEKTVKLNYVLNTSCQHYTFNKINVTSGLIVEFSSTLKNFTNFVGQELKILSATTEFVAEVNFSVDRTDTPWILEKMFTQARVNADVTRKDNDVFFTLLNDPMTTYLPVFYTLSASPPAIFYGIVITPQNISVKDYVNKYTKAIRILANDNITDSTLDFNDIALDQKIDFIIGNSVKTRPNPAINVDFSNVIKISKSITLYQVNISIKDQTTFELENIFFNTSSYLIGDYKFNENTIVFVDIDLLDQFKFDAVKKMGVITNQQDYLSIEQGDHTLCSVDTSKNRKCTPYIEEMYLVLDAKHNVYLSLNESAKQITELTLLKNDGTSCEVKLNENYKTDVPLLRVHSDLIEINSVSLVYPIISDPLTKKISFLAENINTSHILPITSDDISVTIQSIVGDITLTIMNNNTDIKTYYNINASPTKNVYFDLNLTSQVGTKIDGYFKNLNYNGTGVIDFINTVTNKSFINIHANNEQTVPLLNFIKSSVFFPVEVNLFIHEITGECKKLICNNDASILSTTIKTNINTNAKPFARITR